MTQILEVWSLFSLQGIGYLVHSLKSGFSVLNLPYTRSCSPTDRVNVLPS